MENQIIKRIRTILHPQSLPNKNDIHERVNFTHFFHWFAWTISLTASVIFLIFDVRDGIMDVWHDHNLSFIPFVIILLVAIFGSVYSIFKAIHGGILMVAGGIGIVVYYSFQGGLKDFPFMVLYGFPYIIPGVFLIFVRK